MNKIHWTMPSEPVAGDQKPRNFWAMENTSTRQAYWCSWLERKGAKWLVVYWYGRIGSGGKKGYKEFNGEMAAYAYLNAKRTEKEAHGYLVVAMSKNFVIPVEPDQYEAKKSATAKKTNAKAKAVNPVDQFIEHQVASTSQDVRPEPPRAMVEDPPFDPLDVLCT